MSWRVMFTAFIAELLTSLLAGLFFGYWVLIHNPVSNGDYWQSHGQILPDGQGISALSQQLLLVGGLAEPQTVAEDVNNPTEIAWKIRRENLINNHMYSINAESGVDKDVSDSSVGQVIAKNSTSAVEVVSRETTSPDRDWQGALHQALQTCQSKDAFDRPACLWVARSRYCSANHAWGKFADCPARNF